jgi:hypothetical protein
MNWVVYIARRGTGEVYTEFSWGVLGKREHLKDTELDEGIKLK